MVPASPKWSRRRKKLAFLPRLDLKRWIYPMTWTPVVHLHDHLLCILRDSYEKRLTTCSSWVCTFSCPLSLLNSVASRLLIPPDPENSCAMISFAEATSVTPLSSHTYSATFPHDWCIGVGITSSFPSPLASRPYSLPHYNSA